MDRLFSHTNPADRIQTWHALPRQNLTLPQFRDNLFEVWTLVGNVIALNSKQSGGHFSGGRPG